MKPWFLSGRAHRVVLPVVAGALVLSACGGGSSGASSATNLPGSPIVVVGLINVGGTGNESDKNAAPVMQAWGDWVNSNGGISGHPVQVRIEDTRNDVSQATTLAEQLVADQSVSAVMLASSAVEGAIGPVFGGADLPVGGTGYNPTVWSGLPNFYTTVTTFPQSATSQVRAAVDTGSKTVAMVACSENVNCLAAVPANEAGAKQYGFQYAGVLQAASTAPNYTAECLQLIQRGVDFVQLSLEAAAAARLISDCQRQGYKGWFGAGSGTVLPSLYNTPNARLTGGLNGFPWWSDIPAAATYRDAMEKQGVKNEIYENPPASGMWAALETFRLAMAGVTQGDTVTRKTVTQGYGSLKNASVGGLVPMPLTFTAGSPSPKVPCYWIYRYENGAFSPAQPPPICDPVGS